MIEANVSRGYSSTSFQLVGKIVQARMLAQQIKVQAKMLARQIKSVNKMFTQQIKVQARMLAQQIKSVNKMFTQENYKRPPRCFKASWRSLVSQLYLTIC